MTYYLHYYFLTVLQVYQVAIDSYFYGKLVIAPLNIVFYNIFTSHGPDLYGTEHWSFYLLNGILNFNVVFILSMMVPFVVVLRKVRMLILKIVLLIFWIFIPNELELHWKHIIWFHCIIILSGSCKIRYQIFKAM